jgi:hybrid cluster-associated redox disulfide protein
LQEHCALTAFASLRWRKDSKRPPRDACVVTAMKISSLYVSELIALNPDTAAVFTGYGMGCVGCAFARFETVHEAAVAYGLDPQALAASLADVMSDKRKRK